VVNLSLVLSWMQVMADMKQRKRELALQAERERELAKQAEEEAARAQWAAETAIERRSLAIADVRGRARWRASWCPSVM
jgi:hypothetical protein